MKKLLPLAVASMFVLSGSVFAADTAATTPMNSAQTATAHHKTADKSKQHKKHAKKAEATQSTQEPVAK
ncbi:acid-shock protein [Budviciaceae bacterium BWR-B9]|uniref:Acid-shock protein n=1 Tax=Limnobaculum allomyrinae TaxID=2791986 RepID=A0ABS1IVY2_9GAMM|nr:MULTISPECIES: acid-shock protein [Limnobaculum]MBK5145916.1 acid-shock protein [Limnobaculum allomyrinae]MBV7693934.1 acid-shock protein [Limnobaculum sp. M2-1]